MGKEFEPELAIGDLFSAYLICVEGQLRHTVKEKTEKNTKA